MQDLCAICIANLGPELARPARTTLAGLAVCVTIDPEDGGGGAHFDVAWQLAGGATREAISNADGVSLLEPFGSAQQANLDRARDARLSEIEADQA